MPRKRKLFDPDVAFAHLRENGAEDDRPEHQRPKSAEEQLSKYVHDPLAFVRDMFPWGDVGELAEQEGPDTWQREALEELGAALRKNPTTAIETVAHRFAFASGHGVGKSAFLCWVILWAYCTKDTAGVITANTETQLKTKTWAQLAKWYRLCKCRHLLEYTATALFSANKEYSRTWRLDMTPWSERNTEAFAGLHNLGKRILVIYDEASAIPDVVWETTEGALTDKATEIIWIVCGNPTRSTGRFRECFGRFRHRWSNRHIDGRTSKITNKSEIAGWEKDFGEDSDFFRVRVRGEFPRTGSLQFISGEIVEQAMKREGQAYSFEACILGVDIARQGEDACVLVTRRGRDAKTWAPLKWRTADLMQSASIIAHHIDEMRPDAVFIDEGGVGAGVVDRLRQLGYAVIGVQFGSSADNAHIADGGLLGRFANKRAEMWASMREWLKIGAIAEDHDLKADLTGVEYGHNKRDEIQLESKEDMKKRGLASPDFGDALCLTFAFPVTPRNVEGGKTRGHVTDFDPFPEEHPQ